MPKTGRKVLKKTDVRKEEQRMANSRPKAKKQPIDRLRGHRV
jgi:hypothetical protein